MNVTRFSIKRPVFTIVTMILFLLLGTISLTNIPLKLMPDINPPIGAVVTNYPNAGPDEVLDKVSKPLESSLATVPGLNNISSVSMEGASMTILEFSWSSNIDEVENDIISRMNQAALPSEAGSPRFLKFDPSQMPIIQLSLSADDEETLSELAEELKLELSKVNGVASVDITGQTVDEIVIELDQEAMEDYGLDQTDVVTAIQAHHVTSPGGIVQSDDLQYTTRVLFELTSLKDIRNIVLTIDPLTGDEVTVADVADVSLLPENASAITRTNQEPAIMMNVQQQSDTNLVQVATAFSERLEQLLDESKYSDIEAAVLFNQGDYVQEAISNVSLALIVGGLFAILVLFAFLRSVKTPFIIGIAIPFSVIVTFVLLFFTNLSLNIMTLGGLALGIGMLVDNSIVVIENIYRHLSMRKDPKSAAFDGTKEVGGAITASTLTTISVFLPVVFISGIVGDIFMEFALTVSFSLLASLVVALTVVPMMASRILKTPKENIEEKRRQSKFIRFVSKTIKWSLKHRVSVIGITVLLLIGGFVGISQVGTEFIPATDEGYFQINVEMERGTPLEDTLAVVEDIEEVLDDEQTILHYMSTVGSSGTQGSVFGETGSHEASIFVTMVSLNERNQSTIEFADSIRKKVERAAGDAEVSMEQQAMMSGAPNTITFNVTDSDPARLEEVVDQIAEEFEEMSEFNEVTNDLTETVTEIQFLIDEEAAREHGFAPAQIAQMLNQKMNGALATQIVTDDNDIYEVYVRYDDKFTNTVEAVENLLFKGQTGEYVALGEMVDVVEGEGPVTINRINQESAVQFTLQYGNQYGLGEMSELVQSTIDDLDIPEETSVTYTGDQELMSDAMNDLMLALLLALVFVYLVLAAQFESFKYPFVIMFSVPLVAIGVALALTVTWTPISVMAFIGLIVLAGIVVNNAIVLVDYINKMKAAGMRSYDAIVEGVKDRTRPILMTSVTTILGLVPLALGFGEGSEIQQPMAITVIGGLISSTFLTLIFIPVIYSFFDRETRNLNRKYVTPDGQLIPAYLIDEKISEDHQVDHGSRYALPETSENSFDEKTGAADYYEPASEVERPAGTGDDLHLDDEHEEQDDAASYGKPIVEETTAESSPSEKEGGKRRKDITKEDLLDFLEEMLERDRRNNDRER
ncbi:hydrophobic/amphiphilic exporter-1, HAE1 family [Evansella caseinilytica]|uniref:Hydrophobic/amphiphilic exporter-1, HAE1 family n=1 Tax=Evansella caseinilytica TaxID=1503961 RepID=A0A1H3TPB7_9BACI|nr:efflux RND transporter permease subunit [Evansella caseinilytica]SDZ51661.1 hydrophobic/amphiphilic exporter-1, HAE1 family [Evansella caseinilytica]